MRHARACREPTRSCYSRSAWMAGPSPVVTGMGGPSDAERHGVHCFFRFCTRRLRCMRRPHPMPRRLRPIQPRSRPPNRLRKPHRRPSLQPRRRPLRQPPLHRAAPPAPTRPGSRPSSARRDAKISQRAIIDCRPFTSPTTSASSISTAASGSSPRPFWISPAAWPRPTHSARTGTALKRMRRCSRASSKNTACRRRSSSRSGTGKRLRRHHGQVSFAQFARLARL